jgi:hypothetical protein
MNTHDPTPTATNLTSPEKRAYHPPQVTDLGDVRELTRSGGGSSLDGRASPAKG